MPNNGVVRHNPVSGVMLWVQITRYCRHLALVNRESREPITGDLDVDVSLTSFGPRIDTVWKTVESIGLGSVRPRRVILWLENRSVVDDPPEALQRLARRGLEIRHCKDYGPHKKYFPYVMEEDLSQTLVTADDDMLYPDNWLRDLIAAHRADEVTAYRARIRTEKLYRSWPMCTTDQPSDRVFATGVSGVAYPPALLSVLRARGEDFLDVCPRADDFWLHYAAVANGILIRQVFPRAADWWPLPGMWNSGLFEENKKKTGNDAIAGVTRRAWL